MHDIKFILEKPFEFADALSRRAGESIKQLVFEIRQNATELRALDTEIQRLQALRNSLSKEIGTARQRASAQSVEALTEQVRSVKETVHGLDIRRSILRSWLETRLLEIPNIPAPDVPDGEGEQSNVEAFRFREPKIFNFDAKQHFELGQASGLMDFETAAKMSGARFVLLRDSLARLERALGNFMLDLHTQRFGYQEVSPPLLVRDSAMLGTGQLPKFEDDSYAADDTLFELPAERFQVLSWEEDRAQIHFFDPEDEKAYGNAIRHGVSSKIVKKADGSVKSLRVKGRLWLIPTSEVSLTNQVRDSVLEEAQLPLRFTALTPCFRSEAGAAGKDTRGMIRMHQFSKVELVSITTPEQSEEEHRRMTDCAVAVLHLLELPFRLMLLCTGDMGFSARKTYDLEVWLPGQNAYREISSCSNCGDFQARRMDARYKPQNGKGTRYVHTLNGSGLAVGRTLVAVLENYQRADGSIRVPKVLQPYLNNLEVLPLSRA